MVIGIKLQERSEKGFCYTCDEKFAPGTQMQKQIILLVHQDDNVFDVPPCLGDNTLQQHSSQPLSTTSDHHSDGAPEAQHINLHAMLGHPFPETSRFHDTIHNKN